MTTIAQLTFVAARTFEWQEVPKPRITSAKEALIRPLAVTRCDLDLYIANGSFPLPGPFAIGHETAGEVVEVGDEVSIVSPGDRVILPFQISCGECNHCQHGLTNACSAVPPYSAYGLAPSSGTEWGGGLSDLVRVPFADAMLVPIPKEVSLAVAAALSDNLTDGYRTVAGPLATSPRASVLVMGGFGQSVGLFAVASALELGAERVVYCDASPTRRAIAHALGAETRDLDEHAEIRHESFPVVVDASASALGVTTAIRSTAACGTCTSVSNPIDASPELPLRSMYMKGIKFELSRVHARAGLEDSASFFGARPTAVESILTKRALFADANSLLSEDAVKMVFYRDAERFESIR